MRLSEAIRLGSLLGPQITCYYVAENGGSCALGAAIRALGLKPQYGYAELRRVFPTLRQSLVEAIVKRNDSLGWTREQIADWIVSNNLDCVAVLDCSPQEEQFPSAQLVVHR
ncbi:MAG: hypothetical protein JOZ62_21190 [Acidobacteriaceae bacterium]|nr:hypothetical protein [Acidobacteriaceae bacterium]